jgi:hypothetical protein
MVSEHVLVLDDFGRDQERNPSSPKKPQSKKLQKEKENSPVLTSRSPAKCAALCHAVPLDPVRIGKLRHWTKNTGSGGAPPLRHCREEGFPSGAKGDGGDADLHSGDRVSSSQRRRPMGQRLAYAGRGGTPNREKEEKGEMGWPCRAAAVAVAIDGRAPAGAILLSGA